MITEKDMRLLARRGRRNCVARSGNRAGLTVEIGHRLVELAHAFGLLAMNGVGTLRKAPAARPSSN